MPAAPSSSDPVQTDVVHVDVACAPRSQVEEPLVLEQVARAGAARDERRCRGSGRSSNAAVASIASMPLSVRTRPGSCASQVTCASGRRESTS